MQVELNAAVTTVATSDDEVLLLKAAAIVLEKMKGAKDHGNFGFSIILHGQQDSGKFSAHTGAGGNVSIDSGPDTKKTRVFSNVTPERVGQWRVWREVDSILVQNFQDYKRDQEQISASMRPYRCIKFDQRTFDIVDVSQIEFPEELTMRLFFITFRGSSVEYLTGPNKGFVDEETVFPRLIALRNWWRSLWNRDKKK